MIRAKLLAGARRGNLIDLFLNCLWTNEIVLEGQIEENYQTALRQKKSENNVHSYGCSFGLIADDISYLEKQYKRVNRILTSNEEALRAGYDVSIFLFSFTNHFISFNLSTFIFF